MVTAEEFLTLPVARALIVLLVGLSVGFVFGRLLKQVLEAAGVPELVEGTPFERTAQSIGTSTVSIIARLSSWFIYGVAVFAAINVAQILESDVLWIWITGFIPQLFIATLVVIVGFVIADKAELLARERTKSVKLPEVVVVPKLVKYSVLFVAFLIALSQIGVATDALIVLLAAYCFAAIFLGGIAFRDMLRAGASGMYVLLREPYSIGDEIHLGEEHHGIVQGVDVFTTRIETDSEEVIVPNHVVFDRGVSRKMD